MISTASSAGRSGPRSGTHGIASVTQPRPDGRSFLQATMTPAPDSQAASHAADKVRTEVHAIPGAQANRRRHRDQQGRGDRRGP
jgi:RND superfamily putative drug exporter